MLKIAMLQKWFSLSDEALEGMLLDRISFRRFVGLSMHDGLGNTKDKAAPYTKKHGKTYHGYKAHVATDAKGMITDYVYDTAKVHDSQHIDQLISDTVDWGGLV